ncbi:max-like protein X isoform X3 [Lithobates pipiens]
MGDRHTPTQVDQTLHSPPSKWRSSDCSHCGLHSLCWSRMSEAGVVVSLEDSWSKSDTSFSDNVETGHMERKGSIVSRANSIGSTSASSVPNTDDEDSDYRQESIKDAYKDRRRRAHTQAEQKRRDAIKFPSTPQEWQIVASHFASHWDFPNCGGAIDGKHVRIVPPPNSGSYYYNYKGFNSIVMLALVSATYHFLYVDVGQNGRMSDGGVFARMEFYWRLQSGSLSLPPPEENQEGLPFIFVTDEAFALANHLMRPFPMRTLTPDQRIFNFRLAGARRVVENTFGILASRFRLFFLTPIHMAEYKINHIVLACCVLHNLLKRHSANYAVSVGQDADLLVK